MTGMSDFEPITIPTRGASTSSSSNSWPTSVSVTGVSSPVSPLTLAATLSTARSAMSVRICLPSNWIRSAAA